MTRTLIEIRALGGRRRIEAEVAGHWAVHPALMNTGFDYDLFSITHMPSGFCLGFFFTSEAEAIACSERVQQLRADWGSFEPGQIDDNLRDAVKRIAVECGGERRRGPDEIEARKAISASDYRNDLNGYGRRQ